MALVAPPASANPIAGPKTLHATVNGVPTTATLERFMHVGDQIFAVAALAQPAAISTGETLQRLMLPVFVEQTVSVQQAETCEVLTLHIGALQLTLLGLVVEIDAADITLSAERGKLLGNLLCPLVDLFNAGNLGGATAILNRILDTL